MINNQKSIHTIRLLSDLIILNISFIFAAVLAQSWETLLFRKNMFILLLIQNLLWNPLANSFKLYDEFVNWVPSTSILNLFKIILVQTIIAVFFIFIYREGLFTRIFIIEFSISLFLFLIIKQYFLRKLLKTLRKRGVNFHNLAIIGNGEQAKALAEVIKKNPQLGFNLLGMIDDGLSAGSLGSVALLEKIILEKKIDTILIELKAHETDAIKQIIRIADRLAISSYLVPDYSQFLVNKFKMNYLGEFPIISFRSNTLDEFQLRLIKRTFDLLFALVVLVTIAWWLFPLIAILIKIDSHGPALFVQKRNGYKYKSFLFFKFRTLTLAASSDTNSTKPITDEDDRITKIGRFLRKSNLDELPQIFNIFLGNMSVVGPRPHTIPFDKLYSDMVEVIKLRYRVKPGLTGWAQIHGFRGDKINAEESKRWTAERIRYDNWYIENWSLWLDIQIVFSTIWQMVQRKNMGN